MALLPLSGWGVTIYGIRARLPRLVNNTILNLITVIFPVSGTCIKTNMEIMLAIEEEIKRKVLMNMVGEILS